LEEISFALAEKVFFRFPKLGDYVMDVTSDLLRESYETTKKKIEDYIEVEQNYIYTNDVTYLATNSSIIPVSDVSKDPQNRQPPMYPTKIFVSELRNRVDGYVKVVLRNIRDTVPKTIGYNLVNSFQLNLRKTIHQEINSREEHLNALNEPPQIAAEREVLTKVIGVLNKSKRLLEKDPDLAVSLKSEDKLNGVSIADSNSPLPAKEKMLERGNSRAHSETRASSTIPTTKPDSNLRAHEFEENIKISRAEDDGIYNPLAEPKTTQSLNPKGMVAGASANRNPLADNSSLMNVQTTPQKTQTSSKELFPGVSEQRVIKRLS